MRVLFTTWAWPSHYFPMVPLAWALRMAGHEVRMTSQPELLATMLAAGLPATAVGHDVDVAAAYANARRQAMQAATALSPAPSPALSPFPSPAPSPAPSPDPAPARSPARAPAKIEWVADRLAAERLAADPGNAGLIRAHRVMRMLEDETRSVFAKLRQSQTDRSRSGPRLTGAPLYGEVAEAMTGDLLALAQSWRPDLIVYDPLTYAGPQVAERIGVPAVRSLFGPDVTYFVNATSPVGLGAASVDPCPPSLQFTDAIAPTRRIHTRFVPYNGVSEVPSWLPDRSVPARICLTWGTSIHRLFGEEGFLPSEVLLACDKLASERGAELVVAITRNQRHLLPHPPPGVRVVESVPLDALLPTCQAIIHQGGAGTTLTALRHGLPQIILSQVFDQAANAFQLAAAGACVTRAVEGLAASDLLADGHELLDTPSYRTAARRLRQEMLDQPSPDEAVRELATLV